MNGWNAGEPSPFGYAEMFDRWSVTGRQDMVKRDRNHPSIVMWSIGNEVDYPKPVLASGPRAKLSTRESAAEVSSLARAD